MSHKLGNQEDYNSCSVCSVKVSTDGKCGATQGRCAQPGQWCSSTNSCSTLDAHRRGPNHRFRYVKCANSRRLAVSARRLGKICVVREMSSTTKCGPRFGRCSGTGKFCSDSGKCTASKPAKNNGLEDYDSCANCQYPVSTIKQKCGPGPKKGRCSGEGQFCSPSYWCGKGSSYWRGANLEYSYAVC
jgi:hypothetical protein